MKQKVNAKQIFDAPAFDDIAHAQASYDDTMDRLHKWKIGAIVALADPWVPIAIMNYVLRDNYGMGTIMLLFAIPAFISYFLAGGLRYYLGFFGKLAKFGWFIVPVFPIDIFVFIIIMFMGFFIMIYLPIIFVLLARVSLVKERKSAESFLQNALSVAQEEE